MVKKKNKNYKYYQNQGFTLDLIDHLLESDHDLNLPKRVRTSLQGNDESGWASHYGGLNELFWYTHGIPGLMPLFSATWQHGCVFPWAIKNNPEALLFNLKHSPNKLILVANDRELHVLESMGYNNVKAIGVPFCYAKPKILPQRKLNSFLFMPLHSLDGAPIENQQQINAYCDYVAKTIQKNNLNGFVCLHMSCIRNGQYWQELVNQGIRIVAGADHFDIFSYRRMWELFSQFETVATNAAGSHLFYSLASGCKLVFDGPKVDFTFNQLIKDKYHLRCLEEGYNYLEDRERIIGEEKFFKRFSVPLNEGVSDKNLGLEILGFDKMLSPRQIRILLKWTYPNQFLVLIEKILRKFRFIKNSILNNKE